MNIFWAALLGIVQGLTEFIPVSSSGHLVLAQSFIPGFKQPGILFDVVLHMATLAAVFYFFRKRIFSLSQKYLMLLAVGTIPAILVGFLLQKEFEKMFGGINTLGFELLITGFLNILVDKVAAKDEELTFPRTFLIGIAQAIAIVPGISRSGATIFTGVKLGIDRKKAAEFSFLLSIPAILGANLLQILSHGVSSIQNPTFYLVGFIAALVSGYFSIGIVYKFLLSNRFKVFGFYSLVLGTLVIILL